MTGEQCVELDSQEPSLCKEGTVLLLHREEVFGSVAVCEHNGFAAEGADLCASNVEDIAQAGDVL